MRVVRVKDVLRYSAEALKRAGVRRSLDEAERILCRVLDSDRVSLYLETDWSLGAKEFNRLERMLLERAEGLPLQYIIGRVGFYTCELITDYRALIPRPDTETVIDAVLDLAGQGMDFGRIADVGTGSGNLAIVLAQHFPHSRVWATDISEQAISLAGENAFLNGVEDRIFFIVADLLEPFARGGFDLVVANPPYVSDDEWSSLPGEVREHEPSIALRGGLEGLDVVRPMIRMAFDVLSDNGVLVLELGHKQYDRIRPLLVAAGYRDIELRRDINGKPRVAAAFKNKKSQIKYQKHKPKIKKLQVTSYESRTKHKF